MYVFVLLFLHVIIASTVVTDIVVLQVTRPPSSVQAFQTYEGATWQWNTGWNGQYTRLPINANGSDVQLSLPYTGYTQGCCPTTNSSCDVGNRSTVAGTMLVVQRGGCSFSQKFAAAQRLNATGILVINYDNTLTDMTTPNGVTLPGALIMKIFGDFLLGQMSANPSGVWIATTGILVSQSPAPSPSIPPSPSPSPSPNVPEVCISASPLTCSDDPQYLYADTALAHHIGQYDCGSVPHTAPQVWFSFTLAYPGHVDIQNCVDPGLQMRLSLFSGTCTSLSCVTAKELTGVGSCVDGTTALSITLGIGTYYIMAHGVGAASGNIGLWIKCNPSSTTCNSGATYLPVNQSTYISASTAKTVFEGPFDCAGVNHTAPQVWFFFSLSYRTTISLSNCDDIGVKSRLSLFGGSCSELSCITAVKPDAYDTCADGVPALSTVLDAGTYFVMVHAVLNITGTVGLKLTYPTQDNPNAMCVDRDGWTDRNGYTCTDYTQLGWCDDWWYGSSWDKTWGPFSAYAKQGSVGADQACCNCGFARIPKSSVGCILGDWASWSACTSAGDAGCQRTRIRSIVQMPYNGASCSPLSQTEQCSGCSQCAITTWSSWSCHAPGYKLRTRHINSTAAQFSCQTLGNLTTSATCRNTATLPTGYVLQMVGSGGGGRLGLGDTSPRMLYKDATPNPDGMPITDVVLGGHHSAVFAGGLLYVCGSNVYGQLGLGDGRERITLQMLPSPTNEKITLVALGQYHSAILLQSGSVYTFGYNNYGQLGLGTYANSYSPSKVQYVVNASGNIITSSNLHIATVVLGGQHSAFLTSSGQVYTFGDGSGGKLAFSPTTLAGYPTPIQVSFFINITVTAVALGFTHSAFITASDTLYTCGYNTLQQLGIPTSQAPQTSTPLALAHGMGFAQVVLGQTHSVVRLYNGTLLVFGDNQNGQLGLGAQVHSKSMSILPIPSGVSIAKVAAAWDTSAFITDSGSLWAFGSNSDGQTGLSGVVAQYTPQEVATYAFTGPIRGFALGYFHAAILRKGTVTPTLTPLMTKSDTTSQTMTTSMSGSPAPTGTPTSTNPQTLTPSFASCVEDSRSLEGVVWTFQSVLSCMSVISLGAGSTNWYNRNLVVRITTLPAPLKLEITDVCTALNCTTRKSVYSAADDGKEYLFSLNPTSNVTMSILYGSIDVSTWRAVSSASKSDVTFFVEYNGTVLLLVLACWVAIVVAAVIVALLWMAFSVWNARHKEKDWYKNHRLADTTTQLGIGLGTWGVITGVAWCAIVDVASWPTLKPVGLIVAGVILASLGFLLAIGCWTWAMRDPVQYICTACNHPVSRWRFIGTYYPHHHHPLQGCKAHSRHILCVLCGKHVIKGRWQEAPPSRPYHWDCWHQHCLKAIDDPSYVLQWVLAQRELQQTVSQEELAHILAVAVIQDAPATITELMQISPSLPSVPIAQEEGRTALHLAAHLGNLSVFLLLMQSKPHCLDPVCTPNHDAPASWCVKGLEEGNDVYVYHPFLLFNARPVYIGHSRGWYLYYYDPSVGTTKTAHPPGWCISQYLGTGSNQWRLPLSDDRGRAPSLNNRERQTTRKSIASTIATTEPAEGFDGQEVFPATTAGSAHKPNTYNMKLVRLHHTSSLMEEAIGSGSVPMIQQVIQLYQLQDPGCLLWKYYTGHGLWDVYPSDAQVEIKNALTAKLSEVLLCGEQFDHSPVRLDLTIKQQTNAQGVAPIKGVLRSIFQQWDATISGFQVTSNADAVLSWNDTVVVCSPAHAAMAAPDHDILALLVAEGVVEFASWRPPTKVGGPPCEIHEDKDAMMVAVLHKNVIELLGMTQRPDITAPRSMKRYSHDHATFSGTRGHIETGIGSRLTDGLEEHQSAQQVSFYPPGYSSNQGTLPFCAALPENTVGLNFLFGPITQMAVDALTKLHELQQQRTELKAQHIVALYVYSYELAYDTSDYHQIYGAMNHAMRLRDQQLIDFWRPLIWEIDMALHCLPAYKGKAFRGINCQLNPADYPVDQLICWPSFSSASRSQGVAEEFAKGEVGTLFFLTSASARSISAISRFPEEEEVLFPPNTLFQISSTLFSTTDIGAFYGRVDNIAMVETSGEVPRIPMAVPRARLVGHTSFLLHVPSEVSEHIMDILAEVGIQMIEAVEPVDGYDDLAAELLLVLDSDCRCGSPCNSMSDYWDYVSDLPS